MEEELINKFLVLRLLRVRRTPGINYRMEKKQISFDYFWEWGGAPSFDTKVFDSAYKTK